MTVRFRFQFRFQVRGSQVIHWINIYIGVFCRLTLSTARDAVECEGKIAQSFKQSTLVHKVEGNNASKAAETVRSDCKLFTTIS